RAPLRLWPSCGFPAPPPRVVFDTTVQLQFGERNCGAAATSALGRLGPARTPDPRRRVGAQHPELPRLTGSQCRFLPSRWPLVQRQDTRLLETHPGTGPANCPIPAFHSALSRPVAAIAATCK